jgi:outer membrane receptor protein involved in Fe transport
MVSLAELKEVSMKRRWISMSLRESSNTRQAVGRLLMAITVFLFLISSELLAQVDRGNITGKVSDQTGSIIPGAKVTVVNLETGVPSETVTNDVGLYTVPNVPLGRYKVLFSMDGFKTLERTGITVTIAQTVRLDVVLELGEFSETLTVTAEAGILNTENPLIGTTIQSGVIRDLPLSFSGGRQVESFAYALTPAVEGNGWTSYIAGGPAFTKEVLIDGLSATAQIQGELLESSPTMEAIQEFKVQTSGMSAEYGRTSGGVFNFSLKSGTNDFHGSGFYYTRNEALNANTWMNNWRLTQSPGDPRFERARDRQSLGGFSAGGPVVIPKVYDGRNKTFIFGAFEHYVQERLQLGTMNTTVPIPAFLSGDFSALLTNTMVGMDALDRHVLAGQIFDPKTLRQVGNRWVADPFPGNVIPANRLSGVSSKIADIYRKSYQPMMSGFLTNNSALPLFNDPWFHQTQLTFKGDHSISAASKLSGSLIWTQRPRVLVDQGGVWDPLDADRTGGAFSRARTQEVTSRSARLSHNWTLRSNLINTASFAFNRYRNPSLSSQADGDWGNLLGLGSSTNAGHFPDIEFGSAVNGVGTTRIGYNSAGYYVGNTYVVNDSLLWAKGRHMFKFGGEFYQMQLNGHGGVDTLEFNFDPRTTGIPGESWSNRVGFGFASFFLGEVDNASKNVSFDLYGRRNYMDLFVNDDFKVNNRVTLTLGLRWEQTGPFHEKYGHWANFNPNLVNTNYNLKGALEFPSTPDSSFETKRDWKEFSPRVGLAYQATDKLVLRGSYGTFYNPIGINYWFGVPYGFAPGFRGVNQVTSTGNVPRFNWDGGYPDNYKAPTLDPNNLVWGMVAIDEKSLSAGYTHQYNVSFQYEIGKDMVLETAFLGNQGRRLHSGALRRNQPTRAAYEDPKVNPFAWVSDQASATAAGVPYPYAGFSAYAGMALQPFPHVAGQTWGPVYYVGSPLGQSGYNSWQVSFTRRMSQGLAAQGSYNFAKATGNVETGFDETWDVNGNIQDAYDLSQDATTVLSYDQTHVLKGQVTYELPFGRGRKWMKDAPGIVDAFLGGWTTSTIFRYNSGFPLAVSPNVSYPGWEGTVYANVAPNADFSKKFDSTSFNPGVQNDPGNLYFDPANFSNPTDHKLGNGSRRYDDLRGFGSASEDFGLLKHFRIREGMQLQVRAEMINVFNRHYFADPGTSLGNSSTFGFVNSTTGSPRVIQVGGRFEW